MSTDQEQSYDERRTLEARLLAAVADATTTLAMGETVQLFPSDRVVSAAIVALSRKGYQITVRQTKDPHCCEVRAQPPAPPAAADQSTGGPPQGETADAVTVFAFIVGD